MLCEEVSEPEEEVVLRNESQKDITHGKIGTQRIETYGTITSLIILCVVVGRGTRF